jgi:hypothetical protein
VRFFRRFVELATSKLLPSARLATKNRAMSRCWSLISLSLLLAGSGGLAGCTQSQSRELVDVAGESSYPARLPLSELAVPAEAPPLQPDGAAWARNGGEVAFAVPGQTALFALSCTHDAAGAASLALTRHTRAAEGAKALLALIGNGRIARLPLDVSLAGEAGEWRGAIPAGDARLDVLKGGNRIEATLPGGGTLLMPASGDPGRLLEECRASAPRV